MQASAWAGTTVIARAPCHLQNAFTSIIWLVRKEALRGNRLFPNEACVTEERTQASQGKGTAGAGDAGDGGALVQSQAAQAPRISSRLLHKQYVEPTRYQALCQVL